MAATEACGARPVLGAWMCVREWNDGSRFASEVANYCGGGQIASSEGSYRADKPDCCEFSYENAGDAGEGP